MSQIRDHTLGDRAGPVAASGRDRVLGGSRCQRRNAVSRAGCGLPGSSGGHQAEDLLVSHISINFDRTGLQADWNVAFPLERLKELAADGVIGSVAETHYSFMGASDPIQMEPHARELAGHLKRDQVDSVLLCPV